MDSEFFALKQTLNRKVLRGVTALATALVVLATPALAEPKHGIAMYGEPALPADFAALPYANPTAPEGGSIRFGESGGFDSLNPYILKGKAPWNLGLHTVETLMYRTADEPFTLYGLLAESVETDDARSWVEFTLRPEAKFSDGSPVTVEDVMWSYETLGTKGHARYKGAWEKIASMESPAPGKVRFTFKQPDRELALIMGMRPILKKAQWEGKAFDESTLEIPIGSGAYIVDGFEAGKYVSFRRNPDYWGKDLPVNQGLYNLDRIRYDYYGDGGIVFEAFKAGEVDIWRETNAAKWASAYDFPAVASGDVVKVEIPHQRPSGIKGFAMNTRRAQFADWKVREALITAFNHEYINTTLAGGSEPRICSYFCNSPLAYSGAAQGREAELLAPFKDSLLPGTLEGYTFPVGDGTQVNRAGIRTAAALLEEAGWSVQDGVLKNAAGEPFKFEILLTQGANEAIAMADIYTESLKQLGIQVTATAIDSAQINERMKTYDFDMAWIERALSLSPGNEQLLYWGAKGVEEPGTRNIMGANNPAIEGMVGKMLETRDPAEYTDAVRALDRVLTAGRYVIPVWYPKVSRMAFNKRYHYPATLPLYGDWPGFAPDTWWVED